MLENIDHIIVLMFENRSFDNMLGWLYEQGEVPRGQSFEGLAGKDISNPIPDGADQADRKTIPAGRGHVMTNPNPDPGEEYYHVNTQLFGVIDPASNAAKVGEKKPPEATTPYNLPSPMPTPAPMNGFVKDYIDTFIAEKGREPSYEEYRVIMDCFTPKDVPVISALAKGYAVCDHWFCDVPSQTFCNRSFITSATSNGLVLNPPYVNWVVKSAPTIYDRIEAADRADLTWRVYFDKMDMLASEYMLHPSSRQYWHTNFAHMETFYEDCKTGNLPSYAFMEPRLFLNHNDEHPPINDAFVIDSVLAGEVLLHQVYDAVRNSPAWEKTLLVITYDEHGGCFDHVSPPTFPESVHATPPEPDKPAGQMDFKFDRLGVRVPAILISPYIEAGTVINEVFSHSSVMRTLSERWGLPNLTERDKAANSLSHVFNRTSPRQDTVITKPRPYTPEPYEHSRQEKLGPLQRALLVMIAAVEKLDQIEEDKNWLEKAKDLEALVAEEIEIAEIKTVGQALDFIAKKLQPLAHLSITPYHEHLPRRSWLQRWWDWLLGLFSK